MAGASALTPPVTADACGSCSAGASCLTATISCKHCLSDTKMLYILSEENGGPFVEFTSKQTKAVSYRLSQTNVSVLLCTVHSSCLGSSLCSSCNRSRLLCDDGHSIMTCYEARHSMLTTASVLLLTCCAICGACPLSLCLDSFGWLCCIHFSCRQHIECLRTSFCRYTVRDVRQAISYIQFTR